MRSSLRRAVGALQAKYDRTPVDGHRPAQTRLFYYLAVVDWIKYNTHRFADYKEQVIDLLRRVTAVSVGTQELVEAMKEVKR